MKVFGRVDNTEVTEIISFIQLTRIIKEMEVLSLKVKIENKF